MRERGAGHDPQRAADGARVVHICHEHGIGVPDEVSVVGYDDSGLAAHAWPALTTIRVPLEDMGQTATRMLDELIEKGD